MTMPIGLRPARSDDFDFCSRLYFQGMAATIRELKLNMVAQTNNLRESWNAVEVRIITSDGADVGWMQSSVRDGEFYLEQIFSDAAFQRRGIGTEIIQGVIDRATQAAPAGRTRRRQDQSRAKPVCAARIPHHA
jgi:GNAT superfamily N-acetyltransferase